MRKLIAMMVVMAALCAAAHAQEAKVVRVNPQEAARVVSYFEEMKFTGSSFSWLMIDGVREKDVTLAIDNADGKRVFEITTKCVSYSDEQKCQIQSVPDPAAPPAPYLPKAGDHFFRILVDGKEAYSIKYKISLIYGSSKTLAVSGDWNKIAAFTFNTMSVPETVVILSAGDDKDCNGESYDLQAQLYRDDKLVAQAVKESLNWAYCYPEKAYMSLFKLDDSMLANWITQQDLRSQDGNYEVRVFRNKALTATYAFALNNGEITSTPPAGIQKAFSEAAMPLDNGAWIYLK